MTIENKNLSRIKKEFISEKLLSVYNIEELIGIKRSRAMDYIKTLKSEGFIQKIGTSDRKAIYGLVSSKPVYDPLSDEDVYRHIILLNLYKPMTRYALYIQAMDHLENLPISSFYRIINRMIEENIISEYTDSSYKDHPQTYVYPSGIENNMILNIGVYEQSNIILRSASGMVQGKALRSLYKKISMATGCGEYYDYDESVFLQYGRGYKMDKEISRYYLSLQQNHFKTNALLFNYRGKKVIFSTGLVVYSQDKDMLYLIGHKSGTRGKVKQIIKCSDISDISCTDKLNDQFNKPEYLEYLENMFSISAENKPEHVKILFEYSDEAYLKLERLCRLRVNAKIVLERGQLVYTDTITGMPDFEGFLRSFGYKFTVISPDSLKKSLNDTLQNILNLYK